MFCRHFGCILEVFLRQFGGILESFQWCFRVVLEGFWRPFGHHWTSFMGIYGFYPCIADNDYTLDP